MPSHTHPPSPRLLRVKWFYCGNGLVWSVMAGLFSRSAPFVVIFFFGGFPNSPCGEV